MTSPSKPAVVSPTIESLRCHLPGLCAEASARAGEFETLRKLAPDFAERLLRSGAMRVLVPATLGGLGGTYRDLWDVALALATADGSTGWVTGQCAMYSAVIAVKHPPERVRAIFSDPLANVTGSGNGEGVAEPVEGGYRVSGRWGFTSGCTLATHLTAHPKIPGESDAFGMATLALASEVRITETWDVVGLAGTGSHQIEFDNVFVPLEMTNRPFDGKSELGGGPGGLAQGHWWDSCVAAAVELGIAKHVLDEVWRLARVKPANKLPGSPMVAQEGSTLRVLQWCRGILFAQEAAMEKSIEMLWDQAEAGTLTPVQRAAFSTAAVTAVHESKRAIDMAYEVAGSDGLQNANVLSRLIRDAQAMPVHTVARKGRLELIGRVAEGDGRLAPFI